MTLIEIIRANPDATDAEIIAIAETPVYRSIKRYDVIAILAGSLDALKQFATQLGDHAAMRDIFRLVDGLLGGLDRLDVADMPKVALLGPAAVQAGVITQDQFDALIAAGSAHVPFTPTAQEIADARLIAARINAANAANAANGVALEIAAAINQRHAAHGDVNAVTLTVNVPEGFVYTGGEIVPE